MFTNENIVSKYLGKEKMSKDFHDLKCVCFDLDDTLCDYEKSAKISRDIMMNYAISRCKGLDLNTFQEAYLESFQDMINFYGGQAIFLIKSGLETRLEHFSRTLYRLGFYDPKLVNQLVNIYGEERMKTLKLFSDSIRVLTVLKRKHRLSLVTNGPSDIQRSEIELLNIEEYFDEIVVSGEVGYAKPDPRIFKVLLTKLKITPSQMVYIGNSQKHDIIGAKKAGLKTVWINRKNERKLPETPIPDYEITTLSELIYILP
jgi:HAD superfamily hydrolase (TIGR02253 family)